MNIEFRPIKENERKECLALWYTVFSRETDGFFERYFTGDVEWLPYYTQVAVLDGKLVSAVQTVKRTVACGDFRLTMGGIANVATLPEYRGKGYNQELLKRAIEVMEADAMDFSMLGTGINTYYAKLGYSTLECPVLEGDIKTQIAPSNSDYTIREATGDDLPAIRAVYDLYNAKAPIAVQRYEAYWRDWMRVTPEKPLPNCLVAENDLGDIVGYLSVSAFQRQETSGLSGVEFGVRRGQLSEQQEKAVSHALFAEAIRRGDSPARFQWQVGIEALVAETLRGLLIREDWGRKTGWMVRLLHRTNLMQSFTLAWNESWTAAGRPKGTVSIQTPYGTTTIDANGNFLRVIDDDNTPNAMPQETFFGLLFGTLDLDNGAGDSQTTVLLRALFPPRSFVYWNRDGF